MLMSFPLAVPGAVVDPSLVRDDGIALRWRSPQTDNSTIIFYYLIEWTIFNKTYSANVTAEQLYFGVNVNAKLIFHTSIHHVYYRSFLIRIGTISLTYLFELLATMVSVFRDILI